MRVDRHMLNWGIFFVCLGAVPLAVQRGAIPATFLTDVGRLWPLVLVVIGVSIVLSRTPADFVGGMLVAASFGLVFGGFFAAGPSFGIDCGSRPSGGTPVTNSGSFAANASVDLKLSCGTMNVATAPGSGWTVSAANSRGDAPSIVTAADRLTLRAANENNWFLDRGRNDWNVTLPQATALALSVSVDAGDAKVNLGGANVNAASLSVNAGSARFDLTGSTIGTFDVSVNAGSGSAILPSGSDIHGSASVNLGSLELCAPPDLGLQIQLSESLASSNLSSAGLLRNGDTWRSASYDAAAHHAILTVSTNLGSLTLNPAGGCK